MKKITLLIFTLVSLQMFSQDQFNISINGGIPIGNIEAASGLAFGADANYLFDLGQDFKVGPSIGFVYFSVEDLDEVEIEAPTFLPISASILFHSSDDRFYVGGELGYAVAISDYDSGFFIKPTIGYHLTDGLKLNAFYAGIKTSEPTYGYAGLGLTFNLNSQSQYYSN